MFLRPNGWVPPVLLRPALLPAAAAAVAAVVLLPAGSARVCAEEAPSSLSRTSLAVRKPSGVASWRDCVFGGEGEGKLRRSGYK